MARQRTTTNPLTELELFTGLSRREFDEVSRVTTEIELPGGYELIREGAAGTDMFVLLDGDLEVRRRGETVATVRPGGFVGEMAALTGNRRNATVVAPDPVRVIHIDGRGLSRLLRQSDRLAGRLLPVATERASSIDSPTED